MMIVVEDRVLIFVLYEEFESFNLNFSGFSKRLLFII